MLGSPLQVSGSCEMFMPLKLHGIMSQKRVIFIFTDQGNSKNLMVIKLHDHNVREVLKESPASLDLSLCISEVAISHVCECAHGQNYVTSNTSQKFCVEYLCK